jgi:hypothetical protein
MCSRFRFILVIAGAVLLYGCARTSPELVEMSQSFSRGHPEYVIGKVKALKSKGKQKAVEIDFEAPNHLKSRGRSILSFEKQADGTWKCVQEQTIMWEK